MTEELGLLQKMLSERDEHMAALADQIASVHNDNDNVTMQIDEAQRLLEEDSMTHRLELEDYVAEEEGCRHAMTQLEYEMKQSAKMYEYAKLLREAAAKYTAGAGTAAMVQDSTYIIRLQSQLMKAMHAMGMLDNQSRLYQSQCSGMAKSLREEITRIVEDKSMAELRMMNELGTVHGQMREREEALRGAVEERRAELAEVERLLVERHGHRTSINENEDEDGEDNENDSESEDNIDGPPSNRDEATDPEGVDDKTGTESRRRQATDNEETLLLDEEIERVTRQVEMLSMEKDSMIEHLRMAIAEKDEVLRQMKEALQPS